MHWLQIRSKAKPMCIDSAVDNHNYHKPVNMWPCHNQGGNQVGVVKFTDIN